MPRCFVNSVRGYRSQRFWGFEADSQNVMTTRSGLAIRTIPTTRNYSPQNTPLCEAIAVPPSAQCGGNYKVEGVVRYRSMSYLPFVTRFHMIREGTHLDVSGDPSDTDSWTEESPFIYDKTRWVVGADSYYDSESHLSDVGSTPQTSGKTPSSSSSAEMDVCTQTDNYSCRVSNTVFPYKDGGQGHTVNSMSSSSSSLSVSDSNLFCTYTSKTEIEEAASAAETLVALAQGHPSRTKSKSSHSSTSASSTETDIDVSSLPVCEVPQRSVFTQVVNPMPQMIRLVSRGPFPICLTGSEANSLTLRSTLTEEEAAIHVKQSPSNLLDLNENVNELDLIDQEDQEDFEQFQANIHTFAIDAHGNTIHKCSICHKVFTVLSAYHSHAVSHFRTKNKCNVCGKEFSRSWLLKGHMRTHTGERPYPCTFPGCDKAFADKSNLRSHAMIHTVTGKNHICERCNRAFAQKRYLHKHRLEVCKN